MSRYTVDLEQLAGFIDVLGAFTVRAEQAAAEIGRQVSELHENWSGMAADAHVEYHAAWTRLATEMRAALAGLERNAHVAHRNYSEAVASNLAMLTS